MSKFGLCWFPFALVVVIFEEADVAVFGEMTRLETDRAVATHRELLLIKSAIYHSFWLKIVVVDFTTALGCC